MSNYTPIIAYGPKDSLTLNDPNKYIKGVQIDGELNAISTAISSKYDSSTLGNATTQTFVNSQIFSAAGAGPSAGVRIESATPGLGMKNSGAAVDTKQWNLGATTTDLLVQAINDANNNSHVALDINRTGLVINSITLGNTLDVTKAIAPGGFSSASGVTASTASGTPVVIFTAPNTWGVYFASATISTGDPNSYNCTVMVSVLNNASKVTIVQSATLMTITTGGGLNLSATQTSGATNPISWSVTRIV